MVPSRSGKSVGQGQLISVTSLSEVVEAYANMLGDALFERMLDGYDSANAKGLADHFRRASSAHPFAVAWDDLVKGAARSREVGQLQLSERALFLLDTLHALSTAENDPCFNELLKRLAGRDQFFSTSFEALVFRAYRLMGVPIELVSETGAAGERRPDLVSRTSDADDVFIEWYASAEGRLYGASLGVENPVTW